MNIWDRCSEKPVSLRVPCRRYGKQKMVKQGSPKLTLWALSDTAGRATEARCRKIGDLRIEAGSARLNKSWVNGQLGRIIFRSGGRAMLDCALITALEFGLA